MSPVRFPQANCVFAPPPELSEEQCHSIVAFKHQVIGGSCDGSPQVVVAWQLSEAEIELLKAGGGILYFSVIGGLPPHYPSLTFHDATHPA